jgi:hypothetical protein
MSIASNSNSNFSGVPWRQTARFGATRRHPEKQIVFGRRPWIGALPQACRMISPGIGRGAGLRVQPAGRSAVRLARPLGFGLTDMMT